jgi:hypothetical protein
MVDTTKVVVSKQLLAEISLLALFLKDNLKADSLNKYEMENVRTQSSKIFNFLKRFDNAPEVEMREVYAAK